MNAPAMITRDNIARLRTFVGSFADLIDSDPGEPVILEQGVPLLRELVAQDDWLPAIFARPDATRYRQYLLHCDSRERFSVVSFVWAPGQMTPIHDHRVWGLVGILRGAEVVQDYRREANGQLVAHGPEARLEPGQVGSFGPRTGDIHRVANAHEDRPSVSIHVYGANIGAVERATYGLDGQPRRFVSGYANTTLPNLWDRSAL